jgi:hypothetical protein
MGGDTGKTDGIVDVLEFDIQTLTLRNSPQGDMAYPRWYPSSVTLPDGRIFVVGGSGLEDHPISIPEVWSPTQGWRALDEANILPIKIPIIYQFYGIHAYWYPHTFVNSAGEIIVTATGLFGSAEALEQPVLMVFALTHMTKRSLKKNVGRLLRGGGATRTSSFGPKGGL